MMTVTLLMTILVGVILLAPVGPVAAADPPIILKPEGDARQLAEHMLGFNAATAFYEDLIEDPAKIAPARELAPATLRFPGGTIGNYYDWRRGVIDIPVFPNSARYTRMMSRITKMTQRLHPDGVSVDRFHEFSRQAGAELVLVINMETSPVEEQVEWFKYMKKKGLVPRYIEMGNEFWVAMTGDPNVIRKFPDAPTAMKLTKTYLDAIRPYLPADALIAVQSAGSDFGTTQSADEGNVLLKRMLDWDRDMVNEPWFDALTVRFYPEPDVALGPGATAGLPGNIDRVFLAMMARVDEGTERTLSAVAKRHPDKQIWATEWNPNGVRFFFQQRNPGLTGMMIHCTARTILAFLRHPAVTISSFHQLSYRGGPYAVLAPNRAGEGFVPAGPGLLHQWFNEAINGGASYRAISVEGAKRIAGGGAFPDEGFNDVAAALFSKDNTTTLIIHNAGNEPKRCTLSAIRDGRPPDRIETFDTPDLMADFAKASPASRLLESAGDIEVQAYSVTRAQWQ